MTASQILSTTSPEQEMLTEYYELGPEQSVSPFLLPESRVWGKNLTVKSALCAAICLLFAFILSFFPNLAPFSHLLLIAVYFLAGIPSLIEATEDLLDGDINIDILMTLAAFSSIFIGSGLEGGLLLVLFALSGAMEDAVTSKAKGAISSLHRLSPSRACLVQPDGTLIERSIKDVPIGSHILVKAGQIVPLDGKVIEGASAVNLVHITGENLPITKGLNDEVPAGGRNLDGALTLEVTRTSADSTIAQIIQLVTQAQESRPKLQRWFDKASRAYALSIIALSALFALTLPFLVSIPILGVEGSVYRALAFLIAASPCALIIAIPIAYLSALSSCARRGILLKGGLSLDALASCHAMAFDKTGTLTTGELSPLGIESFTPQGTTPSTISSDEALTIAYALERNAVHPIANAIVKQAESLGKKPIPLTEFKLLPGHGLQAIANLTKEAKSVFIGNPNFIASKLSETEGNALLKRTGELEAKGELLAVLAVEKNTFIFRFTDPPRTNIAATLKAIRKRGWDLVMLTGDRLASAKRVSDELNINEYHAELKPEDKLHYVSKIAEKKGLAMIGDGVNDAPALARATVGICMGKVGSSAAIDAADIVLLHDNIELLDWLIGKAKQTQAVVKQNLFLASGAIIIACIPALMGIIPLWLAVVVHEGGTILVGLNGLRLLRSKNNS